MQTSSVALINGMSNPSATPDISAVPEAMKTRHHWVLYRVVGNKKVPYQPNGKRASVTNPKTWSSFEKVVAAYNAGGFDRIGFVFTQDDPFCGIDLDKCRNPATGEIELWAREIIDEIASYTEVSPSGTGVHIIALASVPEGRKRDGIEIYDRGRFFTMTGMHLKGTPSTIEDAQDAVTTLWEELTALQNGPSGKACKVNENDIDWDADPEIIRDRLEAILASDPEFRRTFKHERAELADDLSRIDMALLSQAVLVHDWSNPTDLYLLIRAHRDYWGNSDDKKKAVRRDYVCRTVGRALAKLQEDEDSGADDVIRIRPGRLPSIIAKAAGLIGRRTKADPLNGIYRRGSQLVRVARMAELTPGSAEGGPLVIAPAEPDGVHLTLARICPWERYAPSKAAWVATDVPENLARKLLANAGEWVNDIPLLTGIVQAPTLRPDGTVLDKPGYDPETGLLFDAGGIEFPPVPETPTREQGVAALKKITDLLAGFPFVDKASLSVAVSNIIAALVRHACRAVPLHVYTAPKMGSGKTLLATLPGYVLTGRPPRLMSQADSPEEERKRLLAVLIEGAPLVVIDNVERVLKSDTLCTILTEPFYSDRLLRKSQMITVPSRATFSATGNNLVLAGDLTSRAVVCALDPKCEWPEQRVFAVNLHEEFPKRRAELGVAALTIVRAYLAAGEPRPKALNFARFEDWSRYVRFPLIWLGMEDPCAGRERIEARDPVREHLTAILQTWHDLLGSKAVKAKDAVFEAKRNDFGQSDDQLQKRTALYEALMEVAGRTGELSHVALGQFIRKHENRIDDKRRFESAGKAQGALRWRVVVVEDHSQAPDKGEVGAVAEVATEAHEPKEEFIIEKKGKITIRRKKKAVKANQPPSPETAINCSIEGESVDLASGPDTEGAPPT